MTEQTPLQRAAAVARHVEIESVSLVSATVASDIDPAMPPPTIEAATRYRTRQQVVPGEPARIHVFVDYSFEVAEPENQSATPVMKLDAEFRLVYALRPGAQLTEGDFDAFAQFNGTYNSWPYWRELVQTVTGRVGLAGIMVPVWRPQESAAPLRHQLASASGAEQVVPPGTGAG